MARSSQSQRIDLVQKVEEKSHPLLHGPPYAPGGGTQGTAWMSLKEGMQKRWPCYRPPRDRGEIGDLL